MTSSRMRWAAALGAVLALSACSPASLPQETTVLSLESHYVLRPAAGIGARLTPGARLQLRSNGHVLRGPIQARARFEDASGTVGNWSDVIQLVVPATEALTPNAPVEFVLESSAGYTGAGPNEILRHSQFRDIAIRVSLREGSGAWTEAIVVPVLRAAGPPWPQELRRADGSSIPTGNPTMSIFAVGLGVLLGVFGLAVAISGLFVWLGARMAGVSDASFVRCTMIAVAASVVTWMCALLFSVVPFIGTLVGFVVGLLLTLAIIKMVLAISFGRAFLVWIFHIVAQIAAIVLAIVTFAGALVAALR